MEGPDPSCQEVHRYYRGNYLTGRVTAKQWQSFLQRFIQSHSADPWLEPFLFRHMISIWHDDTPYHLIAAPDVFTEQMEMALVELIQQLNQCLIAGTVCRKNSHRDMIALLFELRSFIYEYYKNYSPAETSIIAIQDYVERLFQSGDLHPSRMVMAASILIGINPTGLESENGVSAYLERLDNSPESLHYIAVLIGTCTRSWYLVKLLLNKIERKYSLTDMNSVIVSVCIENLYRSLLEQKGKTLDEPNSARCMTGCELIYFWLDLKLISLNQIEALYEYAKLMLQRMDRMNIMAAAAKALLKLSPERAQDTIRELIDSIQQNDDWNKHCFVCGMIKNLNVRDDFQPKLPSNTIEYMKSYLKSLIWNLSDKNVVRSALDAIRVINSENSDSEHLTTLRNLIEFMTDKLQSDSELSKIDIERHHILWAVIFDFKNPIFQTRRQKNVVFNYFDKTISKLFDKRICTMSTILLLRFEKEKSHKLLIEILEVMENKIRNTYQPNWSQHRVLCYVIRKCHSRSKKQRFYTLDRKLIRWMRIYIRTIIHQQKDIETMEYALKCLAQCWPEEAESELISCLNKLRFNIDSREQKRNLSKEFIQKQITFFAQALEHLRKLFSKQLSSSLINQEILENYEQFYKEILFSWYRDFNHEQPKIKLKKESKKEKFQQIHFQVNLFNLSIHSLFEPALSQILVENGLTFQLDTLEKLFEELTPEAGSNLLEIVTKSRKNSLYHLLGKSKPNHLQELTFNLMKTIFEYEYSTRKQITDLVFRLIERNIRNSVIEHDWNQIEEIFDWMREYLNKNQAKEIIVHLIDLLILNLEQQLTFHSNIALKLADFADRFNDSANDKEILNQLFDYFLRLADSNQIDVVLKVLLVTEVFFIKNRKLINTDKVDKLTELLQKLLKNYSISELKARQFDEIQLKFFCGWFLENVLQKSIETLPPVKLTSERLIARTDNTFHHCVLQSPFAVQAGVYFYEVTLPSVGEARIGWANRAADLTNLNGIGTDEYSIAINTQQLIIHQGQTFSINNQIGKESKPLEAGTVIGCLIDCERRKFVFYFNGNHIWTRQHVHFSRGHAYYAVASLTAYQQCHFNFGQETFRYPPAANEFRSFHQDCFEDISQYQLMEPFPIEEVFEKSSFKRELHDNQVEQFYIDDIQLSFDRYFCKLTDNIDNNQNVMKDDDKLLFEKESSEYSDRFLQSVLEKIAYDVDVEKFDIKASAFALEFGKALGPSHREKICQALAVYLKVKPTKESTIQHRNLTMILYNLLAFLRQKHYDALEYIREDIFPYLLQNLLASPDQWSRLFATIALGQMKLSNSEFQQIKQNRLLLDQLLDKEQYSSIFADEKHYQIGEQLCLCVHNFYCQLFESKPEDPYLRLASSYQNTLHVNSATADVKIFQNRLSARGDWRYQRINSICSVCSISVEHLKLGGSGLVYYEVRLETGGRMRIGWWAKQKDQDKPNVGDDEFSLGLDGYSGHVINDEKKYPILGVQAGKVVWLQGDIIGCLIDLKQKRFEFRHNGIVIQIERSTVKDLYFSALPYFAAVSFDAHQQCSFRLNRYDFLFPPDEVKVQTLYEYSKMQLANLKRTYILNNTIWKQSMRFIDSEITINGAVKMIRSQKAASSRRKSDTN